MTAFTLAHTAVSILPIGFGLYSFARHGKISPKSLSGKWYLGTMLVGAVTSFGFIPTFGFTPGQVLTLATLALLTVGTLTLRGEWRTAGYKQTIALTTSFLLLMVFATTETLKQFPTDQPFATSAADPSLIPVRLALLTAYLAGLGYQLLKVHQKFGPVARLERILAADRYAA
ncbi:MAG: hypothetical protein K8U57_18100 [Planctomycetes bacterium]|nr:hypothetical protein [Planctomycetota bacterium]